MSSLFKTPEMPTVSEPKPIPQADDDQVAQARRRRISQESKTSGVQSTLLTAGGKETLGS